MKEKKCNSVIEKNVVADVATTPEETSQEVAPTKRVLRSHATSYVAQKKAGHEAIVSVCFAKTGKRITLSMKQLKAAIGYDGSKDWLDIRYDDAGKAVLIGKSDEEQGVKPIVASPKYIIYSSVIVKDFVDTLCLDFSNHTCVSAYVLRKENIEGKDFIVLTHDDFC